MPCPSGDRKRLRGAGSVCPRRQQNTGEAPVLLVRIDGVVAPCFRLLQDGCVSIRPPNFDLVDGGLFPDTEVSYRGVLAEEGVPRNDCLQLCSLFRTQGYLSTESVSGASLFLQSNTDPVVFRGILVHVYV